MSEQQTPKNRPPTRRPPASARVSRPNSVGVPHTAAPVRRDPFPLIIGGLIGVLIAGIALVLILLQSSGTKPAANISTVPLATANVAGNGSAGVNSSLTAIASQPTTSASSGTLLPGTAVPEEGKDHVAEGTAIVYKSAPPSSGTHYGSTASYGFSDKEIAEGTLVHSLEHGAIVLYYKPGLSDKVLQDLRDAYSSLPPAKYGKVKLVITPYPELQAPLVLAAWGRVLPFEEFNYDKVRAAYQALVDKGPEDVP